MPTSLDLLGLVLTNNTTTGLKRAAIAKDADLLLVPDSTGGLKRYHYDGTNWRSGLRTVSDPASVTIPAGGAFFLRKASDSIFEQWTPPGDEDPDATAYLNAVEAADGQALEPDVRDAVDKFVKGCKVDGTWSAIKASCILAGARTLNGALTPLVGAAPTNVGGNFSSGDYNRESGLKGNGSSKLLDSNRNNNADPQDSHHLAAWVSEADTQVSGNPAVLGTGGANSGESVIGYANSTGGRYFFRSRSSGAIDGSLVARQTGLHAISRTSSTNVNIKLPGHASSTTSLTSQTPRSSTIKVFGRDTTPHWNGRISFYSIGESLNLALLDARLTTLMSDLAAAIP